jgi:hypothetical protein
MATTNWRHQMSHNKPSFSNYNAFQYLNSNHSASIRIILSFLIYHIATKEEFFVCVNLISRIYQTLFN